MSRNKATAWASQPPNVTMPLSARPMRLLDARVSTEVAWVEVTAGGTGYVANFAVTFTGGGGSGATGQGLVRGGALVAVRIDTRGTGYTSDPTPVLTAGAGTGATATAYRIDAVTALAAANASDLVWCYGVSNVPWTAAVLAAGYSVQGVINGVVDRSAVTAASVDFANNPVPLPWLASPGSPQGAAFGAARRAAFKSAKLAEVTAYVGRGLLSVHCDDPQPDVNALYTSGYASAVTGGPFDAESMAGFDPNYKATVQAAGLTMGTFDWPTNVWSGGGNYRTEAALPSSSIFPNRSAYLKWLKQGIIAFHGTVTTALAGRPYTVNAGDPMPGNSTISWLLKGSTGNLFENDPLNWSGASPTDFAQRFTRVTMNVKICDAAGTACIPHLQPIYSTDTDGVARAKAVTVLRQQTALSYALGARPTFPADVYRPPFSTGIGNDRFFGKAAEFADLFLIPKTWPGLFDGTRSYAPLLLCYDSSTQTPVEATALAWIDTSLRQGVPVAMYPIDPDFGYTRDTALEANAQKIIKVHADNSVISGITGSKVTDLTGLPTGSWSDYSMVSLTGSGADRFAIPRVRDDGALIVHIVNFDLTGNAVTSLSGLTLAVKWLALPKYGVARVRWYAPGAASPVTLRVLRTDTGLSIALPALAEWGVVLVEFA